jgi:HK97 family phage portal protein
MSLLQRIFPPKAEPRGVSIELSSTFTAFSGSTYGSAAFRTATDAIARHAAKLKGHTTPPGKLDALLQTAPNPFMSAFDMLYKIATAYYTANNAFALLQRDAGGIVAVYPLTPSSVEFIGGTDGALYTKMMFPDGKSVILPYADIIHLRRHFSNNELLGADNSPLYPLIDTAETLTQATGAAAKNATSIRGILRFTSLLNPQQIKLEKEQFVKDYLNLSNTGGVAATDQRFDFTPTNAAPYSVPVEQADAVNRQIYAYLGVSPKIVDGTFSEDEFQSFYESVIAPLALQMSLEFSRKCGADIQFTSERLEFSSAKTRISLLHELMPFGVLSVNEARRLLTLPDVPDGDRRLQSLNFVDTRHISEYQLSESGGTKNEPNTNTGV